jgi:hypothetical protein
LRHIHHCATSTSNAALVAQSLVSTLRGRSHQGIFGGVTPPPYDHVVRWSDLEEDAPEFADTVRGRLVDPGVLLVATIRADRSPRLSPVEPLILDGDLWLSMMWRSRKTADLARDNRVLVHSIVTTREGTEGEVKLRGRAVPIDDLDIRSRYADAVAVLGWKPEEPRFHLFRIEIEDVTLVRYAQSGDQYVARWPAREEFLRRETSATSVGPPEPVTDVFRLMQSRDPNT